MFTDIELEFVAVGDFTPGEVERAIDLSQNRCCPVSGMLKHSVNITAKYHIEGV